MAQERGIAEELSSAIKGDATTDPNVRKAYSRDTSIFERLPRAVVFPKDKDDVSAVVRYTREQRMKGEDISISPRSAGTDMTGGPLTRSISLVFTKYMNKILKITPAAVEAEPGALYRDVERATMEKNGTLVPSFPASREICAIGGMVSNNSGGELNLRYGKTNRYIKSLDVVLSDGSQATLKPLTKDELSKKKAEQTFEGEIYRGMHALIEKNREKIQNARPHVTKNSAGYALWNVEDADAGTFDLTQVIAGSQGSLALVTSATLGLVRLKEHRAMLVTFISDLDVLPDVVHRILKFDPESFESYDDHTLSLALRFFPQIVKHVGLKKLIGLAFSFTSEAWMVATGGIPKLILLSEFAEDTAEAARAKAEAARKALSGLPVRTRIAGSETAAEKYWAIRRESFSLLRQHVSGLYPAPFIDDFVVDPDTYPQFLPELNKLLSEHKLVYTIAGHVGDGNFHIFPFIDLNKPESRREILELGPKVYKLVVKYKGSITGEHNDGIIRTPYLSLMFGEHIVELFAEVKKIFDPLNILNPGKKVGGTVADIKDSMITHL